VQKFDKKILLVSVIIFLVAFGVRIIHLETIKDNPFFNQPIMDEKYHDEWAQEIAEGHLFERIPFYRAPAYPYFLGLIYYIFGHGYYFPRLIGIIIGSLSCILIYLIGKEMFSHKIGVLSALLACFYGMLLYFDSMLLTTYLEVFFCLLAMFILLKWLKNRATSKIILSGVFWGLASITRPNFLIFIPIFAIYVFIIFKRESVKKRLNYVVFLIIGMIPTILTVMLINILVGRDSVLLAWNGGVNFYFGNNQFADGWTATSPEIDATWWGGYKDAIIIAEREVGRKLLPSQVSNYWFNRGFNYIFSKPFDWAALMIKKIYLLFNVFEISNNQSILAFRKFSPLLRIPLLNFGMIIALSIWGFITSPRGKNKTLIFLFLLAYAFSIVIFFVPGRYRMPLVPFLLIFASYTVFWIIQRFKQRKKQRQIVLSIIAITAMIIFVNTDFYGTHIVDYSEIHASIGDRFFASGNYSKAIEEYKTALTYNSKNIDAINALSNTYMMLGRHNDAIRLFRQSLNIEKNVDALCKLGIICSQLGRSKKAEAYLNDAVALDSTNPEVYYYTGMHYAYYKNPRAAIKNLEISLQYYPDPQYVNSIHYNLGKLYLEIGNINGAKKHLLQAGVEYRDVSQLLKSIH
jgi:tetratricopeptide (TPR) repeat protein